MKNVNGQCWNSTFRLSMARAQRDLDLGPFEWSRKAGNKRCEAKGKEIMAIDLGGITVRDLVLTTQRYSLFRQT